MDCECIKNHYRLITVDLKRRREINAVPKAIRQIEFVGQLKDTDGKNVNGTKSRFTLTTLEKIKEKGQKFVSRKRNSLMKDGKL